MNSIDLYQAFTLSTAKYPSAGASVPEGIAYVGFGFGGECGEIAEKIAVSQAPFRDEGIRDELGDDVYYLARLAAEVGIPLSEILDLEGTVNTVTITPMAVYYVAALTYVGAMGRVLERMKKKMRDGGKFEALATLKDDERFKLDLVRAGKSFLDLTHFLGFGLLEVLAANEAKLKSRKVRNVIHGDGDKR